jgi:broad specificity phosphatase PhoE
MDELALARHGESETGARGVVGGDSPLTERGREQARALTDELAGVAIELCLASGARRARETAEIALAGRAPIEVVPELGDIAFGSFEGRPLEEYRHWVETHPPDATPPGGGESRVATLTRFVAVFRAVLQRPARFVLVVAHGLTLSAVLDPRPRPVVAGVPYGALVRLTNAELSSAVTRLERWCEAPSW